MNIVLWIIGGRHPHLAGLHGLALRRVLCLPSDLARARCLALGQKEVVVSFTSNGSE